SQFLQFYITHVFQSLLFFEKSDNTTVISLSTLVLSDSLRQFASIAQTYADYLTGGTRSLGSLESSNSCTVNWFTPDTAFAVYSQFIQLDENRDGLVDWKELAKYDDNGLNTVFTRNVITMSSNGNGLNYLLFLQFAIAYHHLHLPKAQHIIFNYLDKQQQGYITAAALLEYYQESVSKIQKIDNTLVLSAADLVRELYDMIHPKQQN
ncbi:hypothetical protein WA588_001187, partial [Blastocystis sp. NMH]